MRYLSPEISRLFREERRMAFVAGPRQVGKTTLARSLLKQAAASHNYFTWDSDLHRRLLLKNRDSFWTTRSGGLGTGRTRLVLDEIHKYPRWKRFLKGIFDVHGGELEMIVTGSGRLDVYQKGGDSLFGRYALYHLHPFTLGEFLRHSNADLASPDKFWKAIFDPPPQGAKKALEILERFTGFPEPLFGGSERLLNRWRNEHHQLVVREDIRD